MTSLLLVSSCEYLIRLYNACICLFTAFWNNDLGLVCIRRVMEVVLYACAENVLNLTRPLSA